MSNSRDKTEKSQNWFEWDFNAVDYVLTTILLFIILFLAYPNFITSIFADTMVLFRTDLGIAFPPFLDMLLALILTIAIVTIIFAYANFSSLLKIYDTIVVNQQEIATGIFMLVNTLFWITLVVFLIMLINVIRNWALEEVKGIKASKND